VSALSNDSGNGSAGQAGGSSAAGGGAQGRSPSGGLVQGVTNITGALGL
jgi:hypothetical protein